MVHQAAGTRTNQGGFVPFVNRNVNCYEDHDHDLEISNLHGYLLIVLSFVTYMLCYTQVGQLCHSLTVNITRLPRRRPHAKLISCIKIPNV